MWEAVPPSLLARPPLSRAVLSNAVATTHMCLLKCKLIIRLNKILNTIPSTHVAGSYHVGQHRYRAFPSMQKVLLDTVAPDVKGIGLDLKSSLKMVVGGRAVGLPQYCHH